MNTILAIILLSVTAAIAEPWRPAQQDTVYYGPDGRRAGTSSQSGNMTVYRDSAGRNAGSATTDSSGTTV